MNHQRSTTRGLRLGPLIAIVTCLLGLSGLLAAHLKIQVHALSSQRVTQQNELRDLKARADVNEAAIVNLTSRAALQRRLDDGFLKLAPVRTDRIVQVRSTGALPVEAIVINTTRGGLRPIANVQTRLR
jgi:ABC-type uncharacterized transport system YnjBCD substrate-binding protein